VERVVLNALSRWTSGSALGTTRSTLRASSFSLLAFALVLGGFLLRAAYYQRDYPHPDEPIVLAVVGHMRSSGDWDTNWSKADLSPDLRYDQYNFSSYHDAAFLFYRLAKLIPGAEAAAWRSAVEGRHVYRFLSVLLGTIVVGQTLLLGRRAGGDGVALIAGTLAALAPLLVQDAHFARPEAFTTALTLAAVLLSWPREGEPAGTGARVLAAFCVGLLIACKVSLLLLAWLPFVGLAGGARSPQRAGSNARAGAESALRATRSTGFLILALAAGFALGAPGAVRHPGAFVHGVRALMQQYAGVHPPHGHADGGVVADLLIRYFGFSLGWLVLACAGLGGIMLARRQRWREFALLAGPVVLFGGYFATRTVFFERNLSHVVPLALVLAALGVQALAEILFKRWSVPRVATALLALALLAIAPLRVAGPLVANEFSGRGAEQREQAEQALRTRHPGAVWHAEAIVGGNPAGWLAEHFRAPASPAVLLCLTDYADDWSARELADLQAKFELRRVADAPSVFEGTPVCTLTTYHSSHQHYFVVLRAK